MPLTSEITTYLDELNQLVALSKDAFNLEITNVVLPEEGKPSSLSWVGDLVTDISSRYNGSLLIAPEGSILHPNVVTVKNPKYAMAMVLGKFFQILMMGYHSHEAGTQIGDTSVVKNTEICANVYIGHNCTIGMEGINLVKEPDKNRSLIRFPHVGDVWLGPGVIIHNNVCIQRAAIGTTVINGGCEIGNLVNIGHNCEIGFKTVIINGSTICGSVKLGHNCCIGAGAVIRNKVQLAPNTMVAAGAVVTKNVRYPGTTLAGVPAKRINANRSYPP